MRSVALRVTARLVDLALAGTFPVALFASIPLHAGLGGLVYVLLYFLLSAVWLFVVAPVAEAVCVLHLSATPGMLATGLRLVDRGSSITLNRALARSFLLGPLFVVGAMAYGVPTVFYSGWLLWDVLRRPDGCTWPDRVSGLTVVPVWAKQVAESGSPGLGSVLLPPAAPCDPSRAGTGASGLVEARSGRVVRRLAAVTAAWVLIGLIRFATTFGSSTANAAGVVLIVAVAAALIASWGPGRSRWAVAIVACLAAGAFAAPMASAALAPSNEQVTSRLRAALVAAGYQPATFQQLSYCVPHTICSNPSADRHVVELVGQIDLEGARRSITVAAAASHLHVVNSSIAPPAQIARGGIAGSAELEASHTYLFLTLDAPPGRRQLLKPGTVMISWRTPTP